MYIKANHFNYDKLLGGIVEHLDLQDAPLDDQMVSNVFKGFESTYKELRANQKLEDWQENIVIELLSSLRLTCDYLGQDLGDCLDKVLNNLVDIFTGEDDGALWGYVENFYDRLISGIEHGAKLSPGNHVVLANGAELEPEQFANFLRSWVESHLSNELEGINGFLFDAINENVLPREYMKDINVMDIPGSKAKHGDTLITFPLILLEVHNR